MCSSQHGTIIHKLTKSKDPKKSSKISDFQSTFCIKKVYFSCTKNLRGTLLCFQNHLNVVPWSIKMLEDTHEVTIWGFFLGRGFGAVFAIWSISSHVGVQIGLELVRLIALICLNKFWTNVTSPKSLKKVHVRHFDDPSSENGHFWCFKCFCKQFYLI